MATVKAYIASCEKYMDKSRKKIPLGMQAY